MSARLVSSYSADQPAELSQSSKAREEIFSLVLQDHRSDTMVSCPRDGADRWPECIAWDGMLPARYWACQCASPNQKAW
jgi:hypothetical protein